MSLWRLQFLWVRPRLKQLTISNQSLVWKNSTRSLSERTIRPGRLLVRRFINPWADAVAQRNPAALADRIDRYTEGFAVVSTLLCALSAAALANIPEKDESNKCNCSVLTEVLQRLGTLPMKSPNNVLHDAYTISCCTSFFSGACALGLSTVLNVIGAVAPRSYIQNGLVLRHSLALSSIPLFATISGGFIGLALVIGIDMTVCSPTLTYIGIGQWLFTVSLISGTALRGQIGLVRAITAAAAKGQQKRRRRIRSNSPHK